MAAAGWPPTRLPLAHLPRPSWANYLGRGGVNLEDLGWRLFCLPVGIWESNGLFESVCVCVYVLIF